MVDTKDWNSPDVDAIFRRPSNKQLQQWFFQRFYQRMHTLNMSLLVAWYGKHRSGKSLAAVYFSHILDPSFAPNLEERVVYSPKDFIVALQNIRDQGIVGAAVIMDETGVTHGSQHWYDEISKVLNSELQSLGYLRPFLSFVTQDIAFINSQVRRLATCVFEVSRSSNDYATVKPMYVNASPFSSKVYKRYPILVYSRDNVPGFAVKISSVQIGLPPADLLKRYVVHSQRFKDQLLEQVGRDIATLSETNEEKSTRPSLESIIELVVKDPGRFECRTSKPGAVLLDKDLIAHEFKVSTRASGVIKRQSEKILNSR